MLRFVNLKDQITPNCREFAWFDTITDTFLVLNGTQVWNSWKAFVRDLEAELAHFPRSSRSLQRFEALAPKELTQCPQ